MKNYKNLLAATLFAFTVPALAETGLPSWLDVTGQINFDGIASDSGDYSADLRVQDAELRFEILAREGVKLVVKAEFERLLQQAIDGEELDAQLGQMLEEAYIEIQTDKITGLPRATVTVGKQSMAFAQKISQLPMFKDSSLYNLLNEEQMIGLTVTLPTDFFKIVDSVSMSLYEAGAGDMKISQDKAISVKLTKKLTEQIEATVSGLLKEHAGQAKESRATVGFVFTSEDGSYKMWAEGVTFKNNPLYTNSKYGATIGAAKRLGKGAVVVEGSILENTSKEIAVAYNLPIGSGLTLSPEVRYIKYDNGSDDTVVGIRARLEYGSKNSTQKNRI